MKKPIILQVATLAIPLLLLCGCAEKTKDEAVTTAPSPAASASAEAGSVNSSQNTAQLPTFEKNPNAYPNK